MDADPGTRLVAACDIFMSRVKGKLEASRERSPNRLR